MSVARRLVPLAAAVAALAAPAGAAADETGRIHMHHPVSVLSPASAVPRGLSPAKVKSVYRFPKSARAGAGTTVAIVAAFDAPTVEHDLNVFSRRFGLRACTTGNGCFRKVNQTGGRALPRPNAGWALEMSVDTQWVHAIAPGARILLVEARTNSGRNLLAAEDYARRHARYVSNSWGGREFPGERSLDFHFSQPGVSVFFASGDSGTPATWPSSAPNVISVGGTTLHFTASGAFRSETGWSGSGGGCSRFERASAAQSSFPGYAQVHCGGRRATPDVSIDASPSSGVSVFDSTSVSGQRGWFVVGGTSVSCPIWAGRAAASGSRVTPAFVYGSAIRFRDITSGSNGASARRGYDLVTGRGSWIGPTP
jgi:subtilase family serine protease